MTISNLKIRGTTTFDCGTGITLPEGADIEVIDSTFVRTNVGVDVRSAHERLPLAAPNAELLRVLSEFRDARPTTEQEAVAQLEKSGGNRWVLAGETVGQAGLWMLTNPDKVTAIIDGLKRTFAGL